VEVSDSEMLSKVASLRKLDFRSSEAECRVRFPVRASYKIKHSHMIVIKNVKEINLYKTFTYECYKE
jgi:hypothetical protein